ncbi:MAG: hypothetical protein HYX39_06325 [Bacteroidetes bacterium]|nr:hypothetical protein [Bacteroidota bacterium]
MRKYIYIILFNAIVYFCAGQILNSTPETAFEVQHNFNSHLIKKKSIRKITFEIVDKKDFEIPIDKNLVETYEFNDAGKLSRFYYTNISKTIEKQTTITVNRGRRKGVFSQVQTHNDYLYDTISTSFFYANNNLILKRYHDGAMFYESRYYRYDSLNNLTKEMRFRETNNSKDKSIFILGGQLLLSEDSLQYQRYSNGQLKCILLNNENRPYKEIITNFDSLNRKKSVNEHYTAASWIMQEQKFEYSKNRLTSAEFKGNANNEVLLKITYEYDNNNELLTEKHFKNGVLTKELSYITDSVNNLLKSLVIRDHLNKTIRIIKLKYDFASVSKIPPHLSASK